MVRLDVTATRVADQREATVCESGDSRAATRVADQREDTAVLTLVGAVVANDDGVRRRVLLADRTGGPVLPPRRRGDPEAGWTETGVELVLAPGETRALGYATRSPPADPPLAVAETAPVSGDGVASDEDRPREP